MPRLWTIRLYYFACFAALGLYLPFFAPWLAARGVTGLSLGLVTATFPAMNIIGPPAFGFAADALGLRGHLLRLACAGAFVGFAAVSALALAGTTAYAPLFVAVLVFATFRSPMFMMADVVMQEASAAHPGALYGRTRLFGSLGFLVASAAGGLAMQPSAPAEVPLAIAALLFVTFAVSFTLPARVNVPRPPSLAGAGRLVTSRGFQLFLACAFLSQLAFAGYDGCFSLHLLARGASPTSVGLAWALGTFAEVLVMSKEQAFASRAAPPVWLAIAYGSAALRWALLGTIEDATTLFVLQPLHGPTFGLMWISSLAYLRRSAPSELLATAQGVFLATMSTGSVVGTLLWLQVYPLFGGAAVFRGTAVVAGLACALAIVFARRERAAQHA